MWPPKQRSSRNDPARQSRREAILAELKKSANPTRDSRLINYDTAIEQSLKLSGPGFNSAFQIDKARHARGYVAKAKAFSAETVGHVMDVSSQIFGGMGYMEEQDTTLFLRRGKQYQLALGGSEYWEDVIAEEIIDREPVVLT